MTTEKLKKKIIFKLIFYVLVFAISILAAAIMQKAENSNQARICEYTYSELC